VENHKKRYKLISQAHDELGHKGIFSTFTRIKDRFWWPAMEEDIKWYIETCHICQERQTTHLRIPPTVAPIPTLFLRVHIDTMMMPRVQSYRYIIQARCALTSYPEWRMLSKENSKTVGKFLFEEILCRWGAVAEIVTDNGAAIISAVEWLAGKYKIFHIRISGYNSQANGLVERKHFDARESIMKAADNDPSKWPSVVHSVFWAERVTVKRSTGMSPYYMVHGVEPVMPFDLAEATYLVPPMQPTMSTTDLIAICARQLQKRPEDLLQIAERVKAARYNSIKEFENKYGNTIQRYNFMPGDLVLMRNSRIEKELNKKTKPRYLGPLVVIKRHTGGSYVLAELDGSISILRCAEFRVIPYHPRQKYRYNISQIVSLGQARLQELDNLYDTSDVAEHESQEAID